MSSANLQFGGEEHFAASPEHVYAAVTDLNVMANHIPDAVSTQRVDDETLQCTVRPGFSFLRGTMKLTIRLTKPEPGRTAAMQVDASGIGQSMRVVSNTTVLPDGTGTRLEWNAMVVERKGLVAAVSKSLIQAAAGQVIRDAWQKLHDELG